jgi:hypothetical protein
MRFHVIALGAFAFANAGLSLEGWGCGHRVKRGIGVVAAPKARAVWKYEERQVLWIYKSETCHEFIDGIIELGTRTDNGYRISM